METKETNIKSTIDVTSLRRALTMEEALNTPIIKNFDEAYKENRSSLIANLMKGTVADSSWIIAISIPSLDNEGNITAENGDIIPYLSEVKHASMKQTIELNGGGNELVLKKLVAIIHKQYNSNESDEKIEQLMSRLNVLKLLMNLKEALADNAPPKEEIADKD